MGIKEKLSQLKQQIKQDIEYKQVNKRIEKATYKRELAKARITAIKGKAKRDAEGSVNRTSNLIKALKGEPKKTGKVRYRKVKGKRRVRYREQQAPTSEREANSLIGVQDSDNLFSTGSGGLDFFGGDKKGKKKGGWDFL